MTIQGVLVEYESPSDNEIYTNSGLLFANKYVIITGNVLMPYLKQFNLNEWLSKLKPGILNFDMFPSSNIPEINIVIKSNQTINFEPHLKFQKAQVVAGFICKSILSSSQKYLRDWAIDFENKEYQAREFLSLFFILKICKEDNGVDLNEAIIGLLTNAKQFSLKIGQEVFIESTPFGNRAFVNSYSQGVISNITGENCCLLLTDCPTAPGSEGCPVFIKTKYQERFVIGIVISCLNWWKGEWVGLTLAANLVPLLSQLVANLQRLDVFRNYFGNGICVNDKLLSATTKSLVQIVCGSGWGTGILLDKEKGIFLTNSHVIESDDNIVLHWKNDQMKASLVYKTPNAEVYDLAILQCDSATINNLDMRQTEKSLQPPEIGEEVYAAGFPILSRDLKPKPSLTKGHVSQVHNAMIKTTCTVLPGSSGGAILRPGGQLLAVIVSNTKMDDVGVVYPRINMAIPILAVYSVIEQFLQGGDISDLSRLHSNELSVRRQWGNFLGKL